MQRLMRRPAYLFKGILFSPADLTLVNLNDIVSTVLLTHHDSIERTGAP